MHPNALQRLQVLEILYQRFEQKPKAPWVNVKEIANLGDMDFALIALKELGHVKQNGFNYCITGPGLLTYEAGQSTTD
jgi:hypothetical protein